MSTSPRPSPKASNRPPGRTIVGAALALLLAAVSHLPADSDFVGSLIDSEKSAYEEWLSSADDPPVAFLNGDASSVEIYSPALSSDAGLLCKDLDLAELIAASGGDPDDAETVINFGLPRVRTLFGDACLVRPGDRVIAVEAGRNDERVFDKMTVRREKAVCPGAEPYALYASLDRPLDQPPLFFALDPALTAKETRYTPLPELTAVPLPDAAKPSVIKLTGFAEDFHADSWQVPGQSTGTIVILTRRQPSTEDDHLPSMILAVFDGASLVPLWTERVDLANGSGRFTLIGVSDFDSDGQPELVIDGENRKCPYRAIFAFGPNGWTPLALPVKRCGC